MSRPRPVVILGAVLAALTALTTYADIENVIPNPAMNWLRVGTVVLSAAGAFYVQGRVTPLSDPRAKDGRVLVPSPLVVVDKDLREWNVVDPPKVVPAPTDGKSRIQPPPPYSD